MSKNYFINNIPKNKNDFGFGVRLPILNIKNNKFTKNFLIGLEYKFDEDFKCRNLYDVNKKIESGLIKYKEYINLELDDNNLIKNKSKDYELYLNIVV